MNNSSDIGKTETDCSIQNDAQNEPEQLFQLGGMVFEFISKPFGQFKTPKTFQQSSQCGTDPKSNLERS